MKKTLLLLAFIGLASSCKEDEQDINVPHNIKYIYQDFCSQAKSRGVSLKFKRLKEIVLQGEIINSQFFGCVNGYYNHHNNTIYIDTTSNSYKYTREALIFHELGHALLGRNHRNDFFKDNITPVSIMNISVMPYWGNSQEIKIYYINELFNESTPSPSWAK